MVLLAKGLPRDRFRVEVATLTRMGPLEAELQEAGIPVTAIGKRHKVDFLALRELAQFMKSHHFDIVQTWIFAANTYGRVAAHLAKVPVVVVSEMAVDLWKGRSELFFDRKLARWCNRIIGNSQAVYDFYKKIGIPEERLAMIYSGIDPTTPPPVDGAAVRESLGLPADCPLVLFAGRLAEQKRVDDLIKALDLLQHVMPELRTIIAGDGDLRETLENLARSYKLTERVHFLGHRDDVPRLMAASNVVVLPSSYEGLPNLILEAMRHSKPVVATAAPGTTEVVSDGETGLLVPVGAPQQLAKALREILRDPELARRLGEAGHARLETDFRLDTMISQYSDLYESLARERGLLKSQPPG